MKFKGIGYFSGFELVLWSVSVISVVVSFCIFDRSEILSLSASVIGVTSLIFSAKGNPAGQVLMIVFSLLYGIISFNFAYYGEMITYISHFQKNTAVCACIRRKRYCSYYSVGGSHKY